MGRYFLWRVISIIPILLIVSLIAFVLSKNVSQDPVLSYLGNSAHFDETLDFESTSEYKKTYNKLGLDQPAFYFSVLPHHFPKGYHSFLPREKATFKSNHKTLGFPSIRWYGFNNQYHHWLSNAIKFDFGNSYIDGISSTIKISKALKWTFLLVCLSLGLVMLLGIPLGLFSAREQDSQFLKGINYVFYFFYAMPVFWFATLMVMFFTTDQYGSWTNIFPSVGILFMPTGLGDQIKALILPIVILCLHITAYISRQMRNSVLQEINLPYSIAAKSRGISENQVLLKHNLNNALIPMITIMTGMIPSAFSGSLIIEVIFGIPGIGRLLYSSISLADWNVVFGLLMIIGFITILSYLIGDILYTYINPKIKFGKDLELA